MKYCANCGTPNDDMMRFCEECGTRFPEVAPGSEAPKAYGIETKIIQVENNPSVINSTGEFWSVFDYSFSGYQNIY